jgi:PAS domain S-box-containing protein
MDDLYRLTGLKMSIIDLKGRVLVDVGWQDICLKFHRAHPETRKKCLESDTELTLGIPPGEFRTYRCKNNMWHLVTPIIIGERHMGNLFMGQFFFEDEQPDYELFHSQAAQCGFNEADYMAALAAVPRLNKESVETGMAYFKKLASMISRLSYSNIKLARSLAERDALMDSLRKSQQQNEFLADIVRYAAQPIGQGYPDGRLGLVNDAFVQLTGYTYDELMSINWTKTLTPPEWQVFEREKLEELHRTGKPVRYEKEYIRKDGTRVSIELLVHMVTDSEGTPQYDYAFITDITARKLAEKMLHNSMNELEVRVRERTEQLTSLTAELSLSEERERRRIATELHDQVGQTLIMSKIKLESLSHALSSERFGKLVGEIREYVDQSIEEIRSLTFQLSPPLLYEVGFEAAVEWLGEEFEEKHGFQVEFQDDGRKKLLDEKSIVALYQIVRELLVNVAKHAKAKKVRVSVEKVSNKIKISVADDGAGFDSLNCMQRKNKKSGFGLFNIRQRIEYLGGEFLIESEIGQGTRATLLLPLKKKYGDRKML